jgi:hypothetical protein
MSTLGNMKARIALELRRENIYVQIEQAVSTAIDAYQSEPWAFSETRNTTFQTVVGDEFYGEELCDLIKIDYVKLIVGTTPYTLEAGDPSQIESWSQTATIEGEPTTYVWYGDEMRLYPVPNDEWTVRVAGTFKVAEPDDDDEADNAWMTTAERLIRSRAKWELAMHVLMDEELAARMSAAIEEAHLDLKKQLMRKVMPSGHYRTMPF